MKRITLNSICLLFLLANYGNAQDNQWYAGLEGGYGFLDSERATGNVLDVNAVFKDGPVFGAAFGYDFGDYGIEAEISKRLHNARDLEIVNDGGLGLGGPGLQGFARGKSNHTSYMMNIFYDLNYFSVETSTEPFIGTGVGFSNIAWSDMETTSAGFVNDSDNVFSFQVFGGLRHAITRRVELSIKYRYFKSIDVNFVDRNNNAFDTSYDTHDVIARLTYRFGLNGNNRRDKTPQAVPVPISTVKEKPAPQEVYIQQEPATVKNAPYKIYFAWDSSEIDIEGKKIVAAVAAKVKNGGYGTIELAGHADRSGPEEYNQALSLERAEAVKNSLILQGVKGSNISVESFGETMPEVKTADGVRERRNRRVIILIM